MDKKVQQYKNKKPGPKEIMKGYIFKWKKRKYIKWTRKTFLLFKFVNILYFTF